MAEVKYDDFCYDTEFIADGKTIDLVSIGIVAPNGKEYYAISREFNMRKLRKNPWLVENVLPALPTFRLTFFGRWSYISINKHHPRVKSRAQIAEEVAEFIGNFEKPRLWAWYGAYDHVVLAQLWGTINNLPEKVPMWTADLKQECVRLGDPRMPEQLSQAHDAINDAWHNRTMLEFLRNLARRKDEEKDERCCGNVRD